MSNTTPEFLLGTTPEFRLKNLTRVREGTLVDELEVGESIEVVHKDPAGATVDTYTAALGDIVFVTPNWWLTVTTPSVGVHVLNCAAVIGGKRMEWDQTFKVKANR